MGYDELLWAAESGAEEDEADAELHVLQRAFEAAVDAEPKEPLNFEEVFKLQE